MAVTINEFYKQARSKLGAAVIADMLRKWEPMALLPFTGVDAMKVTDTRWQTLPSVGTRRINKGYSEGTGKTEQFADTLAILGGDIKIDRVLRADKSAIEDPLKTQTQMKTAAFWFAVANMIINGDKGSDPDEFEGLKKRVANLLARMSISLAQSTDTLKVKASTANMHLFLDGVDRLIKYTGANALLMNEETKVGFTSVLRQTGQYVMAVDEYGIAREYYGKVPLVDVGLKADQSTEIITNSETAPDGGTDGTSIYGVRFSDDDGLKVLYLNGTQPDPYLVTKESESGPWELWRIDFPIGLHQKSRYAVGRLNNFKMAAS